MILPNSKSAKICIPEEDYRWLVDVAKRILDKLNSDHDYYPDIFIASAFDRDDINDLEDALQALDKL